VARDLDLRAAGHSVLLYDSIDLQHIPADAAAVAGYVDGKWPTFHDVCKRWPHAHHVSIATSPRSIADILDVEAGDATIEQAPAWLQRAHRAGIERPGMYASISAWAALIRYCASHGWPRHRYKVWTAHWTRRPHLCSRSCGFDFPTGAGATQYIGGAGTWPDVSLASPRFLGE
jgi:hypothetical protein